MSRVAATIPAENDLLCEGCGYTLNGLSDDSNCPECGKPIAESARLLRTQPLWENEHAGFLRRFFSTTFEVLFRPTHFYRTLATRGSVRDARHFAMLHMLITAVLVSQAVVVHSRWVIFSGTAATVKQTFVWLSMPLTFALLMLVTLLAGRLTAWEAAYRGLRMPRDVVLRGLYYHAAHYIPVAVIALLTVVGYRWMVDRDITTVLTVPTYLYVLSGEVVAGALYLFWTYWIGMRNMMYANA
ncbi:MAG TPA: hypothetical protein VGR35_13650 [Tepidisphaeraceae bacterium]|nr:hypothetical protein [Tepidisphaeraceae bacterium]